MFRRDAALGLGYGITNFMAAVNVWMSGNDEQRRQLAASLLDGGKIAAAYHELGHGNDLLHNELGADRTGDHFVISGRKEVINNAADARPRRRLRPHGCQARTSQPLTAARRHHGT